MSDEQGPRSDIILISCVKSKLSRPAAAQDLYTSPLFRKGRNYAVRAGVPWFILSAERGLVPPNDWIAPYERCLADTTTEYRAAWGSWVAARLDLLNGPPAGKIVEVHAGSTYVDAIRPYLAERGARVVDTLRGLSMGRRLAWYGSAAQRQREAIDEPDVLCQALLDIAASVTPHAFMTRGKAAVDRRGLYSCWVDEPGAYDLSRGLGLPVTPGLIYAGSAGATRWPSGKRSNNTLWSRVTTMHLAGNHAFSTFRRTLGSILAEAAEARSIDEIALTQWMNEHLRIITVSYDDGDALGRLERAVLDELDPPLNLQGMELTPVRRRLKQLRRAIVNPPGSTTAES